jgi:RNA polymerase sigma-70 factor (ECF subfamily)
MSLDIGQLYQEYHGSLVRMLYRRTGDPDRAEDLAQEVFARAVQAPPRNPRPWLFAVALNLVREDGRKAVRQGRRLELFRAETTRSAPAPDTEMERAEQIAEVRTALDRLTERDREALLLKAEGFNYEEIAATLGLAKGAIGTTLARARRRLVEAYHAEERKNNIEAHVAACPPCAARLADALAIFDESNVLVDRLEMPERKPSDSSAPAPVPLAPAKRFGTSPSPQRLRTLAWAATVVIAAGAGYLAGDWRNRVPGQEQPITVNDRLATPPEASAEDASRMARSAELELAEPQVLEGVIETETVPTAADQPRVGGEVAPAEQLAGRANEAAVAPAAAPAPAPVDALAPEEAGAGVPSRGAVGGGAQVEARAARRDQLAQEAAEGARQRGQDAFAENRPPAGAVRVRDSAFRLEELRVMPAEPQREAELDNAKAAPAAELRARVTPARTATLEEAVQVLNGAIRLIEGASLSRVEIAAPPNVPWAAAQSSLVRVVYQLEGAEVMLSQVRVDPAINEVMALAEKRAADAPADAVSVPQLAVGDTLFASEPAGGYRVWWLDSPSRLLSLSGSLGQEALRRILHRIR